MGFFGLKPPAVTGRLTGAELTAGPAKSGPPKLRRFMGTPKGALEWASLSHTGRLAATAGPQRLPHQGWPGSPSPGEKILQRR